MGCEGEIISQYIYTINYIFQKYPYRCTNAVFPYGCCYGINRIWCDVCVMMTEENFSYKAKDFQWHYNKTMDIIYPKYKWNRVEGNLFYDEMEGDKTLTSDEAFKRFLQDKFQDIEACNVENINNQSLREIIYKSCQYNIDEGQLGDEFKSFSFFCIIMFHFYRMRTAVKSGLRGEDKQQLEINLFRDVLVMCCILSFSKNQEYRKAWEEKAKKIENSEMVKTVETALNKIDHDSLRSYLTDSEQFQELFSTFLVLMKEIPDFFDKKIDFNTIQWKEVFFDKIDKLYGVQ